MEHFPYHLIEILAEKYVKPLEAVKKGVEVSYLSGTHISYYENRYLKWDKSVEVIPEFTDCYLELMHNKRYSK